MDAFQKLAFDLITKDQKIDAEEANMIKRAIGKEPNKDSIDFLVKLKSKCPDVDEQFTKLLYDTILQAAHGGSGSVSEEGAASLKKYILGNKEMDDADKLKHIGGLTKKKINLGEGTQKLYDALHAKLNPPAADKKADEPAKEAKESKDGAKPAKAAKGKAKSEEADGDEEPKKAGKKKAGKKKD